MVELQKPLDNAQSLLQLNSAIHNESWTQELVDKYLALGLPRKILNSNKNLPEGAIESAKELQIVQSKMKTQALQEALDTMKVSEHSLFQTLNGAYVQRSIDKLMHYKNAIMQMKDFPHHIIYAELANAYLAEVLGDNENAMNCYQQIIDKGESPLTEEALNRIAYLCIRTGDSETALMALSVLSEINPMYIATLEQFRKVA